MARYSIIIILFLVLTGLPGYCAPCNADGITVSCDRWPDCSSLERFGNDCVRKVNAQYPKIFFQNHFLPGYPLETEEDLQASISIMDKVRVDDVQVYEYHPEQGTVGGNIRPQLPLSVRRQRVEILRKHYIKRKLIGNVRYLVQAPFGFRANLHY